MALSTVILAAGQGMRMHSDLPKVLHPLAGRPMLDYVIDCAQALGADATFVVHGHGAELVESAHSHRDVQWVLQAEQLGTGHAVAQAAPHVPDEHLVLVLCGDVPLIRAKTLRTLMKAAGTEGVGILTAELDDPTGYGRIVRDGRGRVVRIVEHKDAAADEREIREINTGLMAAPARLLKQWLGRLQNDNAQGEYYLTDVIAMAVETGVGVKPVVAPTPIEVMGVNDKAQLAELESECRRRNAEALMQRGATLADPMRIDIRGNISCGRDVFIDVDVVLEGEVELGDRVRIGPFNHIRDATIGADSEVYAHSWIESASIGAHCKVGPFARLRPAAVLDDDACVGNFVEVKKSVIGPGSKVNHLSYVGDSTLGKGVNVGAGTITCNYDGANKYRTIIGDGAFIGSGTQLVAPVEVGANATIGAGSTITENTPADELTVARARQTVVTGWQRPKKK